MGFQDNSGDIIFDVVLTDEGRRRLANGTYEIKKFALGDDEINYGLYNVTASNFDADLQILQTPVLEAFTNNLSSMNSKLTTYANNDLLHLSVFKLNELAAANKTHALGTFVVAVDGATENNNDAPTATTAIGVDNGAVRQGVIYGQSRDSGNYIRIDTGLNTNQITPGNTSQYPSFLKESQFLVQMDNRLGFITSWDGKQIASQAAPVDGDGFATYLFTAQDTLFVQSNNDTNVSTPTQVIKGPRGPMLWFSIGSSLSLQQNTYLFNLLGSDGTMASPSSSSQAVKLIDSIIKVTGINTGYSINVPVRYVKLA